MKSFRDMNISSSILNALDTLAITTPTPIQERAIPIGLEGRDLLASAQTGTGKTLAYLIPTIEQLVKNPHVMALVLVPTRELGTQVLSVAKQICINGKIDIFSALLIGGESFGRQVRDLGPKTRIIVATPGRVIDHIERKTLKTDKMQIVVLDEMDRMFDIGFAEQVKAILKNTPQKSQKLFFSATIPDEISQITEKILNNPERIMIVPEQRLTPIASVSQEFVDVHEAEKYSVLIDQLDKRNDEGSVIIFVKTKHGAKKLAQKLSLDNFPALAIHGDLRQQVRSRVIADFRIMKRGVRIMVATNVAARGIDIAHINHVINYDLPQTVEEYVHRIGRTGRGNKTGCSLSLVSREDRYISQQIKRSVLKQDPNASREDRELGSATAGFKRESGSGFRRSLGSGFRRESGSGFRRDSGSGFKRDSDSGFKREDRSDRRFNRDR